MGPTGNTRVVQIHPTRRCNLRCHHCYSSSSPDERDMLDVALIFSAIDDAAELGYNWISVSGGEPLLYRPLPELLQHTKRRGLHTAIATNGMLLRPRLLDAIAPHIDLLAISIDGTPESHNTIRNHDRAFETMRDRLDALRERNIPFGFIFTLTQFNLHELQWVVEFALAQGAQSVQIHPLDEVGHATEEMRGAAPDNIEKAYAWLVRQQLQASVGPRLAIQIDLIFGETLKANAQHFYTTTDTCDTVKPLADILAPLIIESDGAVVPMQYGFPRQYALGTLTCGTLADMAASWQSERMNSFYALCRRAYVAVCNEPAPHFLSWYDTVADIARRETMRIERRVNCFVANS